MKKHFSNIAKIALVLVYLVIIAGAFVRMTGSGMGCPDWPKCFGYIIPPTDVKQLLWMPNHSYKNGQIIIKNGKLLVAVGNFKTETVYEEAYFRTYTKHNYAIFNAKQTWIEYINRLIGVVAGIVIFFMAILSIFNWTKHKVITILSWVVLILMGVQGWIGAKVVYSVLNPFKITIHMLIALIIVSLILYIIHKSHDKIVVFKKDKIFFRLLLLSIFLTLIQILLGTQVRQYVDEQVKILGAFQMELVLQNPIFIFYIHRSFSILILMLNGFLFIRNRNLNNGFNKINWVFALILLEVFTGIAMNYFYFPFGSQTLHLIIATIIFGLQFSLVLQKTTFNTK